MSSNITKHISFPPELYKKIELNAGQFGVSFAEYLRHLAINDISKSNKISDMKAWEDSLPVHQASEYENELIDSSKNKDGIFMTAENFAKYMDNV